MKCVDCGSTHIIKNGIKNGRQQYKCRDCKSCKTPIDADQVIKPKLQKMGISIDEFRKRHDVQFILSQVFEKLEDDIFYEKSDILKMTGLRPGYPGMSTILESADFKKYSGRAGGQTYYAKPELIERMKNDGILN